MFSESFQNGFNKKWLPWNAFEATLIKMMMNLESLYIHDIPLRTFSSKLAHKPRSRVLTDTESIHRSISSHFKSMQHLQKDSVFWSVYRDQKCLLREEKGLLTEVLEGICLANIWKSRTSEKERRKCQELKPSSFQFHCICGGGSFLLPSLTSVKDQPSGACMVSLPQF